MKYKSGKVFYNFHTDKNGGVTCGSSAEDCYHMHVECDWATFHHLWPTTAATEKQAAKHWPKAKAKGAGVGGDYGSTKTWVSKNTFEEADGDVEDEE